MSDFWSKRKAAVVEETITEQNQAQEAVVEAAAEEKTDEELLQELGLPDPENMQMGDDFSAFMGDLVPARLKTRALRKLWRINPILANLDNLVDYGEDFTDAAMVFENMQTTYQVGKGMMAHVKEMARQALENEEKSQEVLEDIDEPIEADHEDVVPEDELIAENENQVLHVLADAPVVEDEVMPVPSRHRMQFYFEDQHTG